MTLYDLHHFTSSNINNNSNILEDNQAIKYLLEKTLTVVV